MAVAVAAPTLTLSRTQSDFVFDQHQYAGLAGGIGSGKSYAGAAKALIQELPRRGLGLVVAPTYPMLRDATWRTALEVWAPVIGNVVRNEMRILMTTGAEVIFRSADEPDRLRGPNASWAWIDEAAMCDAGTWPVVIGRLREGGRAGRCWVTTTPKGGNWVYRVFVADANDQTILYRATSLSNPFLDPTFVANLRGQYTERFARQELGGEFLTDTPGALWTYAMFEDWRPAPDLARVVVAVDPSGGSDPENDEQGIGAAGKGVDGRAYVLADRTCKLSPDGWGRRAVQTYIDLKADLIVYEKNFGGDMVEAVIQTAARAMGVVVKTKAVTASRGKRVRAEPVAALYEQDRVTHVAVFPELEDECCTWTPESGRSPNRMDWLVWALTELMLEPEKRRAAVL